MNQKLYNPKFKEKKTAAEKEEDQNYCDHCGHTGFGFSGNLLDDAEDRFA